jgi:hypothetical protein
MGARPPNATKNGTSAVSAAIADCGQKVAGLKVVEEQAGVVSKANVHESIHNRHEMAPGTVTGGHFRWKP